MRIVIIGLGTIGTTLLKELSQDDHDITIIDEDKARVESLIEHFDVSGVVGNGACADIQREARVRGADLAIALTNSDELNVFACLVAKKLGAKDTIARVRNPLYRKQVMEMKEQLGISMIVNPEWDTANEILNLINLPSIVQVERFAKGKALLVEIVIQEDSPLVGETLVSMAQNISTRVLVCAIERDGEVLIPTGNCTICAGDHLHVSSDASDLRSFLSEIHVVQAPLKNIMIVGGGRIGYYLAHALSRKKCAIKLIEKDETVAKQLAEALPKVTVVCGNGASHEVLLEEGIESMDAFVALSSYDEENLLLSMFAKKLQVKKAITLMKGDDLHDMLGELEIENNVSPKEIVADRIISYVRALENKKGSNVLTLYRLVNNHVEALEFLAKKPEKFYDQPLKELRIKENCLIACIIREGEVIIPDGNACIKLGDNVIVVTTHKNFDDLTDIME